MKNVMSFFDVSIQRIAVQGPVQKLRESALICTLFVIVDNYLKLFG